MRRLAVPAVWPRLALGLAVPVVLVVAGGAPALAASGLTAPRCTVTWTGGGSKVLWNIAQNWSTGQVPGATSDVCMTPFAIVTATGPISVHSLRVGGEMTVVFQGTASHPSHVTIATALDNQGNVELDNSSLSAPQVNNDNGLESQGTSVLTSPALHNTGDLVALAGGLTLTDSLAQLSNGTLSGGQWEALDNGLLTLPGDITSLASGMVGVGTGSQIGDPAGHNALTGLTSVGAQASFDFAGSDLTLAGSLVSQGTLNVGDYASGSTLAVHGTLTVAGGTMGMQSQSTVSARTVRIGQGASLSALGTIAGNLVNDGSVGPAYHLAVTGNYTQTTGASLAAGFVPELQVAGKATLAGELIASQVPPPPPGTRATALTFGALSGGFTSHSLGFTLDTLANQIDVIARPQIAASPVTVAPGGALTVNGGDFGLGSNVTVFLDRSGGTVLGTARASAYGAFTAGGTIPSSVPAGTHKLIAVGSDGRHAQTTITVS
jgi:hypothetical protein